MKSVTLLATLFAISCTNSVFAQFDATKPIFTSDNIQSLQGIKQKVGTTVTEWRRPGANASNLSKYIGAMAVNPSNLSQVYFVDNSAVPVLYTFNTATQTETNTTKTFTGATQGSNGSATLPILESENALGINMMAISGTLNKGFAISKEHKLFSFDVGVPSPVISAPLSITDAQGNAVSFANAKGGGLMANNRSRLTALVNVLQPDLTYRYYYFDIDPTTGQAKFLKETFINFNNFDDNTMYISGSGVTSDGAIYNSLYNGNESSLYKFSPGNNSFDVFLSTNNQSIGDVSGAGQVQVAPNGALNTTLAIDFNDIAGSYSAKEKLTTIKWSVSSDEPISKFYVQSSTDGTNFKTIGTQSSTGANGLNSYAFTTASTNNSLVYYRISALKPSGLQKISKVIIVDETSDIKTSISTFPNPATNFCIIKLSEAKIISQVNILDARGQAVAKVKGSSTATTSKQISLQELNLVSGQYYVQVIFDDQQRQTIAMSVQR
jgi:hypothetical protein